MFEALYVQDVGAAFDEIMQRIPKDGCIGLGDSTTLDEIGVIAELENGDYNFLNPWKKGITRAESLDFRRKGLTSDIFLTGTNAVSLDGKLVSIDGMGNRVAGMIFGPLKLVVVTGANKIVPNVEAAIAPLRACQVFLFLSSEEDWSNLKEQPAEHKFEENNWGLKFP